MKKCILTLALGLVGLMGFAQDYVIVNEAGAVEHKYLLKEVNAISHTSNTVTIQQGENAYTYDLANVDSVTFVESHEQVMPDNPFDPVMPIYDGDTPPFIEGCFLNSPNRLYYSNRPQDTPGSSYPDRYLRFYNQDMVNNTIDYESIQLDSYEYSISSYVTGSGNNFTVFFNIVGSYDDGSTYKQLKAISGTITENGIKDLYYGFYMQEKYDPYNQMVEVGAMRIFKDNDGMSYRVAWPGNNANLKGKNETLKSEVAK